jgi:Zn-dependent peptidase ImmA (M78 family)
VSVAEVSSYAARRIREIVDDALERSGAAGLLPTPLEPVREHAGLEVVEASGLGRDVLGAVWLEERAMFVDHRQSAPRRRFTEAHELIHALCPWHEAVLRLDTARELFGPARLAIEAEANLGAAMLIFQGSSFAAEAAALPTSLDAVRQLAARYGASLHAALHHYVQTHREPVAMLTVGRFPCKDGSLPVWHRVESGAVVERPGLLDAADVPQGSALRELVETARRSTTPPVATIAGPGGALRAEAHYNRHAFLVLLRLDAQPAGIRPDPDLAFACP